MAEMISSRSMIPEDGEEKPEDKEKREAHAYTQAHINMAEELQDPETIEYHATNTLQSLDRHLKDDAFRFSTEEILRQLIVLGWGAFEILINDVIRLLLNTKPSLTRKFTDVKTFREQIVGRPLLDALDFHAFNLSKSMGDVFSDVIKIDSVEKIREVVSIAFVDGALDTMLKDEKLWKISQQRHLIVHRRGVVDTRYLAKTSDKLEVGARIKFKGFYVEDTLTLLRDVGCAAYIATLQTLASGEISHDAQ